MRTIFAISIMILSVSSMAAEPRHTSAEVLDAMCTTGQYWIQVDLQISNATPRRASLMATTLYFALFEEHGVTNDAMVYQLSQNILKNTNLVFRFTNPKAIQKLPPPIPDKDLQGTRAYLKKWSDQKLIALDPVESLFASLPCKTQDYDTLCRILSAVLIERDLRLNRGCVSGALSISRPWLGNTKVKKEAE